MESSPAIARRSFGGWVAAKEPADPSVFSTWGTGTHSNWYLLQLAHLPARICSYG